MQAYRYQKKYQTCCFFLSLKNNKSIAYKYDSNGWYDRQSRFQAHKNQMKNLSTYSFVMLSSSKQEQSYVLFLLSRKASFNFYQLQQIAGLETYSSQRHRFVSPSYLQIKQQPARSQSPRLMLLLLRQFYRSQGFLMFLRQSIIWACLSGVAGKLYQCRKESKVLGFSMPECEWYGVCWPSLSIQNIKFPSHLQQVKVRGNFLANLASSQQWQLYSLTLYTQSGTNQLQPFLSISILQRSVSHLAKHRLSTILMALGQNPQGLVFYRQSCPLRPSKNNLISGL